MVVLVEKSNEISGRDGCNPVGNGFIETSGSSYPQTMHDLIQSSKHNFTILESFGTFQGVEAPQIMLMVMSRSCNSGNPPEISQIWFLLHNPSLCMVSLNENCLLKNVWYSEHDLSNCQAFTSHWIQEYFLVYSSS